MDFYAKYINSQTCSLQVAGALFLNHKKVQNEIMEWNIQIPTREIPSNNSFPNLIFLLSNLYIKIALNQTELKGDQNGILHKMFWYYISKKLNRTRHGKGQQSQTAVIITKTTQLFTDRLRKRTYIMYGTTKPYLNIGAGIQVS